MEKELIFISLTLISISPVSNQLIRQNYIYEQIVTGLHDYFNSTCILFLHTISDPIDSQGIMNNTELKMLQEFFSKRYIRTAILDIETFVKRIMKNIYQIKRPLLVFLNDSNDVKDQFGKLVAPFTDLAYPNWLIFFKAETRIEEFFNDIYIPFDCTFMISQSSVDNRDEVDAETIWETYQIDRGEELRTGIFAKWNSEDGVVLPKYSLYQRRNSLHGHRLRVISIEDPPSSMIIRNAANKITGLGGFFGGVISLLQENINCTISYQTADEWGYLMSNGTWTGGISSLIDRDSDIFAAELMMTTDRLDAISFTTPLYSTKCRTYIKKPATSALKWDAFVIPFAGSIWSAIGMATSIFGPIRIIQISIHLTGVVLLAAYSAALISSLAIKTFVMPFETMEGLVKEGSYRFGVVGASADFTFFRNTSDEVLTVLFDKILVKETNLPKNYLEGLRRVCNEEKYAFMTLDNVVSQLQSSLDCMVMPLNIISQTSISMALPPHSPYRGLIDNNILLLRDSGILQRLLNAQWTLSADNANSGWTVVELTDIVPLVVLLIGAGLLSFFLLMSEKLILMKFPKLKKKKVVKSLVKNVKVPLRKEIPI